MANAFNQNPMILDTVWTAGAIPAGLTALTSPQLFSLIKWLGNTTVNDECKITDINGNVIFDEVISTPQIGLDITLWDASNGGKKFALKQGQWVLTTLTHGKLWLWK